MEDLSSCSEKERLLGEYSKAACAFSEANGELASRIGRIDKAEYRKLLDATEDARRIAEDARVAFDRHVDDHGC